MANLLDDNQHKYLALAFFGNLADVRPVYVHRYDSKLIDIIHAETDISGQAAGILAKIADNQVSVGIYSNLILQMFVVKDLALGLSVDVFVVKVCVDLIARLSRWNIN